MGKPWFRYWATSALTRAPVVVRWTFLIGGLRLDTTGFLARKGAATPGDADRDRGASSKRDAGRLMRTVTAISAAEVEGWGVPSEFQRALVADVQKMTQAEDHNVQLSPDCIRHELPTRVFNVKGVYRFGAQPATVPNAITAGRWIEIMARDQGTAMARPSTGHTEGMFFPRASMWILV